MAEPADRPDAFPFRVKNAFFLAQKAQHDAAQALLEVSERSASTQDDILTETRKGREGNAAVAKEIAALRAVLPDADSVAKALEPIREALSTLDQTITRFDRREADYVTALYAAVFNTSGEIVGNTNAGKWFLDSAKRDPKSAVASIADVAALNGDSNAKVQARQKFIEGMIAAAPNFRGLPTAISAQDLERFVALAPGILKAIAEAAPPDPAPVPAKTQP